MCGMSLQSSILSPVNFIGWKFPGSIYWQVADRGYYELKPEYWKEFDPLFAHYYLNEMEEAEVSVFCTIMYIVYSFVYICVHTFPTLTCAIRLPSRIGRVFIHANYIGP